MAIDLLGELPGDERELELREAERCLWAEHLREVCG